MTSTLPPSLRRLLPVLALASAALAACSSTGNPWPGITAADGRAYIAFQSAVHAVDLDTGQEVWRYPAEPVRDRTFFAAPALTESGLLIAGSYDHKVFALDTASGQALWTFEEAQDRIVASPTVDGDTVYIASADGVLYALKAEDGQALWSFDIDGHIWASPVVRDGRLFVGTMSHVVYALDAATGELVWNRDVGGAIVDHPSLVNGLLVVGALGRPLTALDPATGEVRWTAESDRWIWASAASSDGVTYFGDLGGRLASAQIDDGAILEERQLDSAITGRPAIGESRLFVATESGTVYALELGSLNPSWTRPVPDGKLYGPPIIQGDKLLVGASSREFLVAALDSTGGTIRWQFQPGN
jgi:outer membrane protein assembly factor BamB